MNKGMESIRVVVLALLINITFSFSCIASPQFIEAVGIYTAGDDPNTTITDAKERAREIALKSALDKAGIYIESYSKTENLALTRDEIRIITGEIVQTQKVSYRLDTVQGNILRCIATVEVVIETDGLDDILSKDKEELRALSERNNFLLQEYARLKGENTSISDSKVFEVIRLYQQTMDKSKRVKEKLALCKKMLAIDSSYGNGIIYGLLGTIYTQMKQYDKALENDLIYLSYDNKNGNALYACAMDYYFLGDFVQAYTHIYAATKFEPQNETYRLHMRYIVHRLNESMNEKEQENDS